MVRRYADVVEVRTTRDGPTAFVWRDRLYVVRAVLAHWRERRAWWAGASAEALHGNRETPASQVSSVLTDLGAENEVWRVEASRGRCHAVGVYDLRRELSGGDPTGAGAWRLVHVAD